MHSMKNMKGKVGCFVIKANLAKACVRLKWSFGGNVLILQASNSTHENTCPHHNNTSQSTTMP